MRWRWQPLSRSSRSGHPSRRLDHDFFLSLAAKRRTGSALHSWALCADIRTVTDAAVVPTAAPVDNETVVIRLGDGRFAAELDAVAEVGRVPAVTRIPGAPAWLAGVANWRGRLLPVL